MLWIGMAVASTGSPAVLATVVALSLSRRTFASRTEFARSAVLLPVIGLAAGAVGWLLLVVPPVGAALFVAGMSVPIWMRRFGPRSARLGGLIALPLTAVLVAPVPPSPGVPVWLSAGPAGGFCPPPGGGRFGPRGPRRPGVPRYGCGLCSC